MIYLLITLILATLIQQSTGYGVFWAPQATITTLEATMVIPQPPQGPGIHFIWPGLQPSSDNYVFQDVAGDDLRHGAWTFAEWSVTSDGHYNKTDDVSVYPGDSLAISFNLDTDNGEWTNQWTTIPGDTGRAAGETYKMTESLVPGQDISTYGALTQAYFVIELQLGATWDFGHLMFKDIKIAAETADTEWCTHHDVTPDSFTYSMSDPVVGFETDKRGAKVTSCTIDRLTFLEPR